MMMFSISEIFHRIRKEKKNDKILGLLSDKQKFF